ncbi:MAG: galactose mutarotase [Verrucomicrobia bacterium]|nr:galactose mutarotase [Verrucomicrobiota bacterium]
MPGITIQPFGQTLAGEQTQLFTLRNSAGITLSVTDYGARIVSLRVPNRNGDQVDVVLGFDQVSDYLTDGHYLGATIGRFANRIAQGRFVLDGRSYCLSINDGPHSLHGGSSGFDKRLWRVGTSEPGRPEISFELHSRDGDQGYPGSLDVTAAFSLGTGVEFEISYEAVTDRPTIVNLTNHSYFNLAGSDSGTILDHVLQVHASSYTPLDFLQVPTGEVRPVAATVVDFRCPVAIGSRMGIKEPNANFVRYNENYVLDGERTGDRRVAATLLDPKSGRTMTVLTDQPGLQLYTGNYLNLRRGKQGQSYPAFSGICLEPQHFPDSPNHPNFPSTTLRPEEKFHAATVYRFSSDD